MKKLSYPAKRSTIDRQIQFRFHLSAKYVVPMVYITFCKQMEVGLYLPVYRRSFHGVTIFFTSAFIAFCDQTLQSVCLILMYVRMWSSRGLMGKVLESTLMGCEFSTHNGDCYFSELRQSRLPCIVCFFLRRFLKTLGHFYVVALSLTAWVVGRLTDWMVIGWLPNGRNGLLTNGVDD